MDSINMSIFFALKVSEKSKKPLLIMSCPGLGKTTTVELFAQVRGYNLQLLRGNSTSAEEVLGYDTVSDLEEDRAQKTTRHCRPSWFTKVLQASERGEKTLLFLDEITTANEWTQSALLHLVFERMVGDEELPKDTLIVSAGNYAQNLSSQMNMLPPLMNRFVIHNITPKREHLKQFLSRYDGAHTNTGVVDYFDTLVEAMNELDKQEKTFEKPVFDKIGAFIEGTVLKTTEDLMSSGKLDMSVVELQDIYSDMGKDRILRGFVTLRTLNYLRDIAIWTYVCFGKQGLESGHFKLMVEGLVGIGLSQGARDSSPTINLLANNYFDDLKRVSNELDKMTDDTFAQYEAAFTALSEKKKTGYEMGELEILTNKIAELMSDTNIKSRRIQRPITLEHINGILDRLAKSAAKAAADTTYEQNKSLTEQKGLQDVETGSFMKGVVLWNSVAKATESLLTVLAEDDFNYSPDVINDLMATIRNKVIVKGQHVRCSHRLVSMLAKKEGLTQFDIIPKLVPINEPANLVK